MPLQAPAFAWRPASQRDSQDDVVVGEGNGPEGAQSIERLRRLAGSRVGGEAASAGDAIARCAEGPTCGITK